ncbi:MAG: ANTAR domain-containing protein [Elusimicrobiota bacterium]
MNRQNNITNNQRCLGSEENISQISRDIFLDFYLQDILNLAASIHLEIKKIKLSLPVNQLITSMNDCLSSLIKRSEEMVRHKVGEELLLSQVSVEKAKNILRQKLGLSGQFAIDKIEEESHKSGKSVREISEMIILAAKFGEI